MIIFQVLSTELEVPGVLGKKKSVIVVSVLIMQWVPSSVRIRITWVGVAQLFEPLLSAGVMIPGSSSLLNGGLFLPLPLRAVPHASALSVK